MSLPFNTRGARSKSALAAGAEVSATLGEDDALDGCAAGGAGLAMFAVDAMEKLKPTAFALGVYIV